MPSDYIPRLQEAIKAMHGCESIHTATTRVRAILEGRTAWDGDVEVFDVDHPRAKKCYAWGFDDRGQFKATCVLEIPPVVSPGTAVDVAIAAKSRIPPLVGKDRIIFDCRKLHPSLKAAVPEILAHIESLAKGEFVQHETKWGYKVYAPGGFRHFEFVDFSIHADVGNHLRFSLYGEPCEFGGDEILPISKGRGDSYSECIFENSSQKDSLIKYLSMAHKLSKRNKGGKWDLP
jgi:hypothetical protein